MSDAPPPLPVRTTPLLLSALVYPGTGQYAAGRRLAALAYAGSFTVALAVFLVFLARYLREVYDLVQTVWAGAYDPAAGTPSARQLLKPGGYLLLIYAANVYDVAWHLYRPRRGR